MLLALNMRQHPGTQNNFEAGDKVSKMPGMFAGN